MQLPYITLGQLEDTRRKVTQQELDSMRGLTSKSMDDYWTNLHKQFDEDSGVGQSLVRNFHFHDHLNFAIEQRISIALCKTAGSWQREHSTFSTLVFAAKFQVADANDRELQSWYGLTLVGH